MDIPKIIAVIVVSAPLACSAASQFDAGQVSCSGNQSTDSSNGLQIDCAGSLTIIGGSLSSDSFINLTASDTLFLDNVELNAPSVDLTGLSVSLGNNTKIDAVTVTITDGRSPNPLPPPSPIVLRGSPTLSEFNGNSGGQIFVKPGSALQITAPGTVNPVLPDVLPPAGRITVTGPISLTSNESNSNGKITLTSNTKAPSAASICTPTGQTSVFKMLESGKRFCAGSKKAFHRIQYLRAVVECNTAPTYVELAATQDFPLDTTLAKTAECHDVGEGVSSCVLYDADTSGPAPTYAGRLSLRWTRNGLIRHLAGHTIEKSADGCHSESTLKFVKRTQ